MKCSKCNHEKKEGAQVCGYCGEVLTIQSELLKTTDSDRSKENERDMDLEPIQPKRSMVGDEKTIIAISGCGLIFIAVAVVASYYLFKSILTSVPNWWETSTTSATTIQAAQPT